ncbi:dienelactone hydrolase family protein [Singulisphaera acidiphila]|uniref:Dienelactone hydrolase-like enzyme n=1 Tax=Singulisphaera acidiphila (strain ATCC BAA-1392 / DSM 18658 / VKM B-2454 / MOB10) TaxID=886293 RepID=L0DA30_SINAD|nr:dienelactone hydrolase family protein [Singulisphaera acidiphila]AGA26239.1 dienelactone hydrolase-like enzyme [Singulisphaera acidiphila DSM 18658]
MPNPVRPPWLAEVQQPPALIPESAVRPAPLLFDAQHQPIPTIEAWEQRRAELTGRWKTFLGTIAAPRARPQLSVLEEDKSEGVVRQLVRYEAEPGLPIEGYLLRPEAPDRGRPGAVVLHSTVSYTIRQPAGLEGPVDKQIGMHLARRGYVTFSPRCFLWQYSHDNRLIEAVDWLHQRHPDVTGMGKMLFDAIRAVDILAGQDDVDPKRIAAIGHSLGAKEALYLAAFDPRIRATVSSEGGIGLTHSNWEAPWYLGEAIRRPGFPLDNGQVLSLIAPRAFLLIGGNSADGDASWPYIDAVRPVWKLTGAAEAVGLFNHRQGHAFPAVAQERSYQWLDWFLRPEIT